MKNLKGMAVLGVIMAVFVMPVFAAQSLADSVAVVTDHSGNAKVYASGKWNNAEINMPLYEGDTIKTSAESAIEVTFDDATIVRLGDNTELKLTELKRQGSTATTVFNLLKGKFMAIVDKLKNPESRFEVHTKMAIAAVKGTELAVEADDDKTNLGVYTGSVAFTGANGGSVKGKFRVVVNKGNESGCGNSGTPTNPVSIRYMGKFEREFRTLREEIKVVRELKAQGGDAVYKWRIKKKLEKEGKVIGESSTEGTIGGTNANVGQVKNKIQKALRAKLKKELVNEKSHAYRDLKFINEEMKADLHLGKTMTDVHGNRIRVEEFVFRPAANEVDLLSLTLRAGDRLDYMRMQNIFMHDIPERPTLQQWRSMWQKQWSITAPENWLLEQRIKLSNVNDWVFLGTEYNKILFTLGGGSPYYWKLLKSQDIVAMGSGELAGGGDMTVENFTAPGAATANLNNQYVKEQVMFGYRPAATNTLLPSDTNGAQTAYKGQLDKTFVGIYADYTASQGNYGAAPAVAANDYVSYTQFDSRADYAGANDIAVKHTRYYNDGSYLMLDLYLINDYGKIQGIPDFTNPVKQIWGDIVNIIRNSNVEVIAKFGTPVLGAPMYVSEDIDIVSKLLWWLVLNPKEPTNTQPDAVTNW